MRIAPMLFAAVFALASTSVFAARCPMEMKAIDAAMKTAKLDDKKMGEVKKLRAEGEKLHSAGKHAESVEALDKAKKILGI